MNIIPISTHPSWCDPRACKSHLHPDGSVSYEHRDAAAVLRPAAQHDTDLMVRRTQLTDLSEVPSFGAVNVTLCITDTASKGPGGEPLALDVDLDPMDARMLAAQLVVMAEQVEATRSAGREAA